MDSPTVMLATIFIVAAIMAHALIVSMVGQAVAETIAEVLKGEPNGNPD